MSDFDSPWKEALQHFFPMFLAFFFPDVFAAVDWSRGYESLDKELMQVIRDAEIGRRAADKLFKVWLHDGRETWILIHIEVQGQRARQVFREGERWGASPPVGHPPGARAPPLPRKCGHAQGSRRRNSPSACSYTIIGCTMTISGPW